MMATRTATLIAATITTGLMAGLYFAYMVSVLPGLHRTDARTLVGTMQAINEAILNGWFFLAFIGALLTTLAAAVLHLSPSARGALPWIVAALVLYAIGLIVTAAVNVPLNDDLAAAGSPDRIADLAAVRAHFETTWVRWNTVRGLVTMAAFGCLTWALVLTGRTR
jgi:uncharacterized membrane protein